MVVKAASVAISILYKAPAPPLDQVNVTPGSTPVATSEGKVSAAAVGFGFNTSKLIVANLVTDVAVPVMSIE